MTDQGFPVYVQAGSQKVRVGTAYRDGDGFTLAFGGLSIGGTPDAPPTQQRAASGDSGAVFPPYGRSKGAPIRNASMGDLEFYRNGCERSLSDPSKSRWHDKERALLDAIEAEIHRQNGGEGREPDLRGPGDMPTGDEDSIPF